jgi:hypothetical protein
MFESLLSHYKNTLFNYLINISGSKQIILDKAFVNTLSLIASASEIKEYVASIGYLEKKKKGKTVASDLTSKNIVFLVFPTVENMEALASYVTPSHKFYLFFVTKTSIICEQILQEQGIFGDFNIKSLDINLIPLDSDLTSMEMNSFSELYVNGDISPLLAVAKAVHNIQCVYGTIPLIKTIGPLSKAVGILVSKMEKSNSIYPQIGTMIFIDRMADPITPLLSQLTYEGSLDDSLNIRASFIIPPGMV